MLHRTRAIRENALFLSIAYFFPVRENADPKPVGAVAARKVEPAGLVRLESANCLHFAIWASITLE
jgi:hypothetical protein